jgi:hypothetical protein
MTANIVAVGAINAALGLFSEEVHPGGGAPPYPQRHRGAEQQGSGRGREALVADMEAALFARVA